MDSPGAAAASQFAHGPSPSSTPSKKRRVASIHTSIHIDNRQAAAATSSGTAPNPSLPAPSQPVPTSPTATPPDVAAVLPRRSARRSTTPVKYKQEAEAKAEVAGTDATTAGPRARGSKTPGGTPRPEAQTSISQPRTQVAARASGDGNTASATPTLAPEDKGKDAKVGKDGPLPRSTRGHGSVEGLVRVSTTPGANPTPGVDLPPHTSSRRNRIPKCPAPPESPESPRVASLSPPPLTPLAAPHREEMPPPDSLDYMLPMPPKGVSKSRGKVARKTDMGHSTRRKAASIAADTLTPAEVAASQEALTQGENSSQQDALPQGEAVIQPEATPSGGLDSEQATSISETNQAPTAGKASAAGEASTARAASVAGEPNEAGGGAKGTGAMPVACTEASEGPHSQPPTTTAAGTVALPADRRGEVAASTSSASNRRAKSPKSTTTKAGTPAVVSTPGSTGNIVKRLWGSPAEREPGAGAEAAAEARAGAGAQARAGADVRTGAENSAGEMEGATCWQGNATVADGIARLFPAASMGLLSMGGVRPELVSHSLLDDDVGVRDGRGSDASMPDAGVQGIQQQMATAHGGGTDGPGVGGVAGAVSSSSVGEVNELCNLGQAEGTKQGFGGNSAGEHSAHELGVGGGVGWAEGAALAARTATLAVEAGPSVADPGTRKQVVCKSAPPAGKRSSAKTSKLHPKSDSKAGGKSTGDGSGKQDRKGVWVRENAQDGEDAAGQQGSPTGQDAEDDSGLGSAPEMEDGKKKHLRRTAAKVRRTLLGREEDINGSGQSAGRGLDGMEMKAGGESQGLAASHGLGKRTGSKVGRGHVTAEEDGGGSNAGDEASSSDGGSSNSGDDGYANGVRPQVEDGEEGLRERGGKDGNDAKVGVRAMDAGGADEKEMLGIGHGVVNGQKPFAIFNNDFFGMDETDEEKEEGHDRRAQVVSGIKKSPAPVKGAGRANYVWGSSSEVESSSDDDVGLVRYAGDDLHAEPAGSYLIDDEQEDSDVLGKLAEGIRQALKGQSSRDGEVGDRRDMNDKKRGKSDKNMSDKNGRSEDWESGSAGPSRQAGSEDEEEEEDAEDDLDASKAWNPKIPLEGRTLVGSKRKQAVMTVVREKGLAKQLLAPPRDKVRAAREAAKQAQATAGSKWYNLPATAMSDEVKQELRLLHLRGAYDPKHFYKRLDSSKLPKYFQMGTVLDSPTDFYGGRLTNAERKATLADELLSDPNITRYRKKRAREQQAQAQPRQKFRKTDLPRVKRRNKHSSH